MLPPSSTATTSARKSLGSGPCPRPSRSPCRLGSQPLMTISGRAEGEDPVAGSTEPRYGLDHFGFEVDDMEICRVTPEVQRRQVQLRTVDHAVGHHGGICRSAGPGERRDNPAAQGLTHAPGLYGGGPGLGGGESHLSRPVKSHPGHSPSKKSWGSNSPGATGGWART